MQIDLRRLAGDQRKSEWSVHETVASSAKQLLGHRIGKSDDALAIHDDDRVRVTFDHVAESSRTPLELSRPLSKLSLDTS
jgi:hypothetical protein